MQYNKNLLGIVFISILIGVLFFSNYTFSDLDSFAYLDVAKNFASGNGFTHSSLYIDLMGNVQRMPLAGWFPFFPFIVSFFVTTGFDSIFASKIINIIFSVLTLIPLYLLTKRLFNKNIAYLTCFSTIFFYPFVWNQVYVVSESIYIFFLISTLYTLTKKENEWLLASGALAAFAYLTRGPGLLLLPSILLFVLFFKGKKLREKIKLIFYPIFSFSIVALPWWIRNYSLMGNPLYFSKATLFSFNVIDIVRRFTAFEQVFIDLLPFSIFIPIAFYTLRKDRKTLAILLTYSILHILLFLVWKTGLNYLFNMRLLFPAYLFLLVLGAKGMYDFCSILNKKIKLNLFKLNSKILIFAFVLIVFLLLNLFKIYNFYLSTQSPNPFISEIINSNTLSFLNENTTKDDVILIPASVKLGVQEIVRFYTERTVIYSSPMYAYYSKVNIPPIEFSAIRFRQPDFNSKEFVNGLDKLNVKYMALFKSEGLEESIKNEFDEENAKYVLDLLNNREKEIPDFLKLVYNSEDGIVYRVDLS